jgi:hypothetical protein
MSQPLLHSLIDTISRLAVLQHTVAAAGIDFGFADEQLAFQLEALVNDLEDSINSTIEQET